MYVETQRIIRHVEIRSFSYAGNDPVGVPDVCVFYEDFADREAALLAWGIGRVRVNDRKITVFRVTGWATLVVTYDEAEVRKPDVGEDQVEAVFQASRRTTSETLISPTFLSESGSIEIAALAPHYIGCVPFGTDVPRFVSTGKRFAAVVNVEDN